MTRERYLTAYRWMLLARISEEKYASLYRAGKIYGGVFIGKGQEAISVATAMALQKGDIFAPLIRDQAGRLAFGESLLDATRTYLGSRLGPMRGRDGNVHRGKPREGYMAMISHLGAMISVVSGALMARRAKGEPGSIGAVSLGEGATSTGAFHEALNQAGVEKLPLVVVVTDNQYAYSTPNRPPVRLRAPRGPRRGLWSGRSYAGAGERSGRLSGNHRRSCPARPRRPRPAIGGRINPPPRRPWGA